MRRRATASPRPSLDPQALEAIGCFAEILARCGASPREMARAFAQACAAIPEGRARNARRITREIRAATHLLTVWFSDPRYLDQDGTPLALPVRGKPLSLSALLHRVDPAVDTEEVVRYLRRNHAVR